MISFTSMKTICNRLFLFSSLRRISAAQCYLPHIKLHNTCLGNTFYQKLPARFGSVKILRSLSVRVEEKPVENKDHPGDKYYKELINKKLEENQSKKEKPVPEMIYYGSLTPRVYFLKSWTLFTSAGGIAFQWLMINSLQDQSTGFIVAWLGFMGFFTYVTPFLIHMVAKKYVINITYDHTKELYTATTLSFFVQQKKVEFRAEDVKLPKIPSMLTVLYAKGVPLFIDSKSFNDINQYIKLMGYDKPIDFDVSTEPESKSPQKK